MDAQCPAKTSCFEIAQTNKSMKWSERAIKIGSAKFRVNYLYEKRFSAALPMNKLKSRFPRKLIISRMFRQLPNQTKYRYKHGSLKLLRQNYKLINQDNYFINLNSTSIFYLSRHFIDIKRHQQGIIVRTLSPTKQNHCRNSIVCRSMTYVSLGIRRVASGILIGFDNSISLWLNNLSRTFSYTSTPALVIRPSKPSSLTTINPVYRAPLGIISRCRFRPKDLRQWNRYRWTMPVRWK